MIPLHGYDTIDLHHAGKRYLEGSKEMYGKYEYGQHQKRKKSLNQISG
jgi:hypothetical protein